VQRQKSVPVPVPVPVLKERTWASHSLDEGDDPCGYLLHHHAMHLGSDSPGMLPVSLAAGEVSPSVIRGYEPWLPEGGSDSGWGLGLGWG